MIRITNILMISFVFSLVSVFTISSVSFSDQSGPEQDCSEASVDFRENPNKTNDEIIAEMDRALKDSLNKYDGCLTQNNSASASASSGGGAGDSGSGSQVSSVSSGIKGTETQSSQASQTSQNQANPSAEELEQKENQVSSVPPQQTLNNGKIPEDIPPADNDTILQQKIREAAIAETDPVKRDRLWNEYRKYKGIAQKSNI